MGIERKFLLPSKNDHTFNHRSGTLTPHISPKDKNTSQENFDPWKLKVFT